MPITPTVSIWMNGELVDWDDARIHILTHTLHYGMGVFEGIRAYETDDGPGVFRLTDLGGAVSGGIGFASSANLNPDRTGPSMFEPVHGSAPDIAGRGIANPVGQVWSGALMLAHLGEAAAARCVERAIERLFAETTIRTADLGGRATTREVGALLESLVRTA